MDFNEIGEQLISHRVTRGRDIEEVAWDAEIDPERLAAAEDGSLALKEDELERLAESYDVPVTAFFGGRSTPIQYFAGA